MTVNEPVLAIDDIQGDILAGFRKDHVRLVFFQFADQATPKVKAWLAAYATQISTVRQVSGFNAVFRAMRRQLTREPHELAALWRNIGFTSQGLSKLVGSHEVEKFADTSFRAGAERLSSFIGDPVDGSRGDPRTWTIGSGSNVPDALVIIAADRETDAEAEVDALAKAIAPFVAAKPHVEIGEVQQSNPGHEHFGFKDGISQPGVRGKNPDGTFFTPRFLDPSDPFAPYFAAPGQPLVWPGEFLLNLPKQKGANADPLEFRTVVDGPTWATNGSYLVFRRLAQDVAAFNTMVESVRTNLANDPRFAAITAEHVGAMFVGRFKTGCPLMRSTIDDPALAQNVYASNHFFFDTDTPTFDVTANHTVGPDQFPKALADAMGIRCPLGAHIRKVNPRDEQTDFGGGHNNLQKRILRRGIPFGPSFDPSKPDASERGLLFVCYQASIVDQFEFLMQDWVNHVDSHATRADTTRSSRHLPDAALMRVRPAAR